MTLLNEKYIESANNASQFDAGNGIEKEANQVLARFDEDFPLTDDLNENQKAYLAERRADWRDMVVKHYNDQVYRRANYMPWTVCGPANYPAERMRKREDIRHRKIAEFWEKVERFNRNTAKGLKKLVPLESVLDDYRRGKWDRNEVIPSDDPHAVEKLSAMVQCLENTQEHMKAVNKTIRQTKKQSEEERIAALVALGESETNARELLKGDFLRRIGYAQYVLTNNLATIKRIQGRITEITRQREQPTITGWEFDGGKVVADSVDFRLRILFAEKPDHETCQIMRKHGFIFSRKNMAWQRKLNHNAVRAAKAALSAIGTPTSPAA